jgi:hypothetical protein
VLGLQFENNHIQQKRKQYEEDKKGVHYECGWDYWSGWYHRGCFQLGLGLFGGKMEGTLS